ncbi:MAG: SGNH/GDSL hydrolase family protein [Pseudomonadota bacterium]
MTDANNFDIPAARPALSAAALHRLAFYPVLVTQGPWVKWNTVRLQEPKGVRDGVAGSGPDLRVLVAGDSSAAGVGVATQHEALTGQLIQRLSRHARTDWQLVARCGDTTPKALARLRAAQPRRADVAVIGLGVNDITSGTPLKLWLRQTRDMMNHLRNHVGVERIYYSGLPPVSQFPRLPNPLRWTLGTQAERFDLALRDMIAARSDATWITLDLPLGADNMAEDGYHPGPVVYAAWAEEVAKHIIRDRALA